MQHLDGANCSDILSNEQLPIHSGRILLRIPAAALRIVDVEHTATVAIDIPAQTRRLAR